MLPSALRGLLVSPAVEAGEWAPVAVVATAGMTDRGSVDPLDEIGKICRDHDVYFHVDAAYGGAGLLTDEVRSRLAGIELADSVTIDFHKTFYQPIACSTVIFRDKTDLGFITHPPNT